MMNFRQKIMTTEQQNAFITSMNLSKRQRIFFMTELGNSIPLYLGLLVLLLVTCVCAYLLIYNIMYLSVTGNIRYYGLLQTVGMTGRQIYCLIYRQMLFVGAGGMVLGIAGGCGISFFVIPSLVKAFGIRDQVQVVFHPAIFLLTVLLVAVTVYVGSRKPAKIAVTVTPIEANRYREEMIGAGKKKKTFISILSLAAGLSVFVCVIYRSGLAFEDQDLIGKTVHAAELGNADHAFSFTIAGVTDDSSMTGPISGYPPTIIISKDALAALHLDTYTYKACVYYDKAYDAATQKRVEQIVAASKDARCLKMESKIESMEELKAAQGNMTGVGIGISLILAFIGVMNYINTIIGNIANRRKQLAILESIGMTRKQMNHMLMREGCVYALGAILITLVVGLSVTWGLYQSMNYMNVPFLLPIGPIGIVVLALLVICVGAPLVLLNLMCRQGSVVERIRQSDE